jgi:glycosyltransferase involved in cell wall biosynthesis
MSSGAPVEDGLVSVVVPVWNGERFLKKTVDSVLAQTYRPLELIVVDDGSTDRSPDIVESIAAHDDRVKLLRTENRGAAAARNLGISQSRGPFVAMLDDDDLWHPEKIARQVDVLRRSPPQVGLVYCWQVEIDEDDFVTSRPGPKRTPVGCVTAELAKGNFIECSSEALVRRTCIDAVGGYDTALFPEAANDWKLYLALSEICEFAVVPEYLVGYRQYSANMSKDVAANVKSTELVMQWAFENWPDLPQEAKRLCVYNANVYFSNRALDGDRLVWALRHRALAFKTYPTGLFEGATLVFGARFLARLFGIRRTALARRGIPGFGRIPFAQFDPSGRAGANS